MPEDAVLIEFQPAIGGKVGFDAVDLQDRLTAELEPRIVERAHQVGEHVVEPFHHLEKRSVDVGPVVAEHDGPSVGFQRGFEMAEELGDAGFAELMSGFERRIHLFLVVEIGRDRVMDRVNLGDEVGDVELELDQVKIGFQVAGAEVVAIGEDRKDVRGLADAEIIVDDQVRRREGLETAAADHVLDERFGAAFAGHVLVFNLGGFKCEADELAAAGNLWPIPELVAHAAPSPGAKARMASACTRLPGMSPSARLTRRCRSSRLLPAKALLSITKVKWDSPLPSSPAWP